MQLVSYRFLFFLISLFVLYYLIPKRFQWVLLLAASYLFYISSGLTAVLYLASTTVSTWCAALQIGKMTECGKLYVKEHGLAGQERKEFNLTLKKKQRHIMIAVLFLNFGILAVLKYANFALSNVNAVLSLSGSGTELPYTDWLLPLGISYYTFQSMGYLIDIYHKKYQPEKKLGRFALFVSFFPQIIQGPISRFDELHKELFKEHALDWLQVRMGLTRILWGYFKKLVVADRIAPAAMMIAQNPEQYHGIYGWIGMFAYTLQMYGDFTGGIDIVIGVAQLFGVKLPENFERPFFSKSLSEFWRRWHMSLMRWFREYVFFPVSTSRLSQKLSGFAKKHFGKGAGRRAPLYFASIVVWFITGIWHGASWNFVAWGMANCTVLLVSQELTPLYKRFRTRFAWSKSRGYEAFEVIRTFILFCLIEMFEYYPFGMVFQMFGSMIVDFRIGELFDGRFSELGLSAADWMILAASVLLMLAVSLAGRRKSVREGLMEKPLGLRFALLYGLFIVVLIFGIYGQGYDASQFIYNQF